MIVFDINVAYSETTVAVVLEKTAILKISEVPRDVLEMGFNLSNFSRCKT